MISFNDKKPTIIELMIWKRNKNINPRTKRKIKEGTIPINLEAHGGTITIKEY